MTFKDDDVVDRSTFYAPWGEHDNNIRFGDLSNDVRAAIRRGEAAEALADALDAILRPDFAGDDALDSILYATHGLELQRLVGKGVLVSGREALAAYRAAGGEGWWATT